jgi:hypothetical protein
MQASNRNLLAFALIAALASPAVFAQAGTRPVSPTPPTQSDPKASDAVSDRTAREESHGTTTVDGASVGPTTSAAGDTTTTTSTSVPPTMGSGAMGSRATSNAGKGNWWADADTDADGKLSAAEATANAGVNARFATIDGDKDGFVTQDEYRAFFTANAGQGAVNASTHAMVVTRATWLKLDADSDSRISLAEAASDAAVSGAFLALDSNKDGFVTQDEYRAYARTP